MDLSRPFDVLFTVDEEGHSDERGISDLELNIPMSPSDKTITTEVDPYGSEFSTRLFPLSIVKILKAH
jgi:hypothetical protein